MTRRQLQRHADWEHRLAAYIAERRNAPFVWGVHDCVTFANGAVEAVTGVNLLREHGVPAYSTREEAYALIGANGMSFTDIARSTLVMTSCKRAMRGDVVLGPFSKEYGNTYGVVIGASVACPGQFRLGFLPLSNAVLAFMVGAR